MTTTCNSRRGPPALLALVAAIAVFGSSVASAQDAPTGSWAGEEPGDFFVTGASATDGAFLYVFGGLQLGTVATDPEMYQQLRRYDPSANAWVTLAQMPQALTDNAGAYHGGKLYSFGGVDLTSTQLSAIFVYDIATDAWSTSDAVLGAARSHLAAATLGSAIYVAGGYTGDLSAAVESFDPSAESVTLRASLPVAVADHALAAVGSDRLFAIGGQDMGGPTANAWEYSPSADAWMARTPIQSGSGETQPRYGLRSFVINNLVYVTGGLLNSVEAATWEYNPVADSWTRRADMAVTRYFHAAEAIEGKGYVYGGFGAFQSGEEFTPGVMNHPPTADAGGNRTVAATSAAGASVTLDGSASSDPDGDSLSYLWTGPFGSATGATTTQSFPIGTSSVSLQVTDPSGESSTDTITVTVTDFSPPEIIGLTATPNVLWSPNHDMRNIVISVETSDGGDAAPDAQIVSVCSNQATGNEADWEVTGALTLRVRAERSNGQARIYTITVRLTDASGNSSTDTVTVCVPSNQGGDNGSSTGNNRK